MDRPIAISEQQKKQRKKIFRYAIVIVGLVMIFYGFFQWMLPAAHRNELLLSKATRGDIEASIPASGLIVPKTQQLLTSTITARIKEVLIPAGASVKKGQAILLVDKEEALNELASLNDQKLLKEHEITQQQLSFHEEKHKRETQLSVKKLNIQRLETEWENKKKLEAIGGIALDEVEKAALALEIAQLELTQEKYELLALEKTVNNRLEKLEIEKSMLKRSYEELDKKLQLADAVAPRDGVVSWVHDEIGADIKIGDALARVVQPDQFKVEGTIPAAYAQEIRTGNEVILRFRNHQVRARVTTVKPSVKQGAVLFDVQLDDSADKDLRANRKVDLYVVTDQKSDVLRVKNGPAFTGGRYQDVYVIRGDVAERRKIEIGLTNFDYVEIVSGIEEGEELIVSDVKKFREMHEIRVKS